MIYYELDYEKDREHGKVQYVTCGDYQLTVESKPEVRVEGAIRIVHGGTAYEIDAIYDLAHIPVGLHGLAIQLVLSRQVAHLAL